jgi:putative ABC transport system ATP-binding protein
LLILGESGRGKTTLLHLLAGLLKPTGGSVIIGSTDTSSLSNAQLDKFRGKNVGIIFQTAHFVDSLSVEDNLIMPQFLTGNKIDRTKAKEILTRLNLGDKAYSKPASLSVGEAQRVAIARAVINNPQLILADEPTSALDDKNAEEVIRLLDEQASATGAALVIVTHDKRLKDRFSNQITL